MPQYRIDVEEMPEIIEAENLQEAVEKAQMELGVYPLEDEDE